MGFETREVKVTVRELELGIQVVKLDRSWIETNFLLQGVVIQTYDDPEALLERLL